MEEHIGKRVNHERVEEALDTGASKIATGCPFCRVMMTDGVDDVAAANDVPKAEVLDVAQLLLGSLDTSSVTLPEKGTAAKEAEERAAKAEAPHRKVGSCDRRGRSRKPSREPDRPTTPTAGGTKPVTGLGIAGGAKRPGAKKTAAAAPRHRTARSARSGRAAPAKGLGIAAGAKRPGAKKTAAAPAEPSSRAQRPQRPPPRHRPRPNPRSRASASPRAPSGPAPRRRPPHAAARRRRAPPKRCSRARDRSAGRGAGQARARGQGTRHRRRAHAGPAPRRRRPQPAAKPAAPQPEPESDGESAAAPEPSSEGNGETPAAAGEGPRHREGCAAARQALTSANITARYRSANSICHQ